MGYSLILLLLIENGLLFVVSEIFKPVTFNLWNQSVNRIHSKVGSVLHNLTNIVWGNLKNWSVLNPVLIFQTLYNNSWSGVYAFSNGRYKFSIGGQLIFTVNKYSSHELAGIPLDPELINLFMDSSQIIEVLRTSRMNVVHEELRGVPSGEYLRRCHW